MYRWVGGGVQAGGDGLQAIDEKHVNRIAQHRLEKKQKKKIMTGPECRAAEDVAAVEDVAQAAGELLLMDADAVESNSEE